MPIGREGGGGGAGAYPSYQTGCCKHFSPEGLDGSCVPEDEEPHSDRDCKDENSCHLLVLAQSLYKARTCTCTLTSESFHRAQAEEVATFFDLQDYVKHLHLERGFSYFDGG